MHGRVLELDLSRPAPTARRQHGTKATGAVRKERSYHLSRVVGNHETRVS